MKSIAEPKRDTISQAMLVTIQGCITAVAVLLLCAFWQDDALPSEFVWALELFFALHVVWAFWSWRLATGRFLDGYLLFLALLIAFNGGQILLDVAGLLPEGLLDNVFSEFALLRAILLVNASICSFHLGALIRTRGAEQRSEPSTTVNEFVLRRIGLAFLLISAVPMLKSMTEAVEIVVASGYFGLYQQTKKVGVENWQAVLAIFFLPGVLITLATAPKSRANVRMCWALALSNFAVLLFLGSRGAAGMALLPTVILHHWLVRRIRTSIMLAAVTGGLLLIPWIANVRNYNLEDRKAASAWSAQPASIAAVAGIKEMGGSMVTVVMATELIPDRRPYDYGSGYLRAMLTPVPNLFWEVHPTVQAGLYSDWLIREVDSITADRGGGLGFSMIAEAYANFSWLGTPLTMFAMGWLLAGLVVWARSGSEPVRLAWEAIVLLAITMLPRGETAIVVRSVVWMVAIPFLLAAVSKREDQESSWTVPTTIS